MTIIDAVQQYQAIIYEVELGDNLVRLQARKDLSKLSTFLTRELGSHALSKLMKEAQGQAQNHKRSRSS